jgi:pimeloyl-ACP methyl ester carboxylesterase
MINPERLIFIHGLWGSSQGVKATLLREIFPSILTPDLDGELHERMENLGMILEDKTGWTIIGSSLGGLMGAMFTCQNPDRVAKLIMLAPALIWPDFANSLPEPASVPAVIYHGNRDVIVPLEQVKEIAGRVFLDLTFNVVDDDHGLYKTVHEIDWLTLLDP